MEIQETQKSAPAQLIATSAGKQKTFPLSSGVFWRIGRSEDNDAVLDTDSVSRHHALIQRTAESYCLIDIGSRNGSFVNKSRVSVPRTLRSGDTIIIGDWALQFQADGALASADELRPRPLDATTVTLLAFRKITVLVIDMRNFTGLTQRLDEGILCQLIGTWFRNGGEILHRHGSWGQKYIGDSIMSVWVHEDEPKAGEMGSIFQALVSLFEMTASLQGMFQLGEAVKIGAGVNTGYATVGNAGSAQLTDHTALGDTVNLAFRFESACKQADVDMVIGADTRAALNLCSGAGTCFRPFTVSLNGYQRPWSVWGTELPQLQNAINGWSAVKSDQI
jgi:adenylate cyclase